jgi:hypothetical protein
LFWAIAVEAKANATNATDNANKKYLRISAPRTVVFLALDIRVTSSTGLRGDPTKHRMAWVWFGSLSNVTKMTVNSVDTASETFSPSVHLAEKLTSMRFVDQSMNRKT